MNNWKGFFNGVRKGSLSAVTEANVFVVEEPDVPFVETDPTVPQHVKNITTTNIANWVTGFNNNIISGSVTGEQNKVLTLTKRDGSTLSIPFTDLAGLSTDDVINTLNFNTTTGVMTAVTSEGVSITTNLDGRYSLLGHTHPEYAHPTKTWVNKSTLSGANVISNLTIDSLGHPTGWSVRVLTPADIGAEPAFFKNGGFNKSFGFNSSQVFEGSSYGNLLIKTRSNDNTLYVINESGKRPVLYSYNTTQNLRGNYTIAATNESDYFYISSINVGTDISSGADDQLVIPEGFLPKIKVGGTVMFIRSSWFDGFGEKWMVSGDLEEVDNSGTYTPKRGTVVITANTTLNAVEHDQMTLICKNTVDITITIPSGLGVDFDCNIVTEAIGTKWVQFVQGTGTTLIAPHGTKLLTDYTANIVKRTSSEIFNLQGELTI